jgi:DNA-directed RNA polymerase specialized sigma24 family protein
VERARMGELAEIMGELALYERFGDKIGGTVRAVLRARGLTLVHDEVDGLVLEACLAIAAVAGAWSPDGGALPWVYARRRIENCVDRVVGQYTVPLDDYLRAVEEGDAGYPPFTPPGGHAPLPVDDRSLAQALEEMSPGDDRCRLLHDAMDRAAVSPTDRELTLQYAAEQGSGNRSPATTVAAMFDLRDAAVRQRVHRSKRRLRAVAASEQRFAALADLPLLA